MLSARIDEIKLLVKEGKFNEIGTTDMKLVVKEYLLILKKHLPVTLKEAD